MTLRLLIAVSIALPALYAQNDWPSWGHDGSNQRHSPLKQINATNVSKLAPAWQYSMKKEPFKPAQSTPLVVNGVMYLSFPYYHVVALEPETGKVLWDYTAPGDWDSPEHRTHFRGGSMRGMAYWPGDKQAGPQIVFGTEEGHLISVNAKTGRPNPGFGNEGIVNIRTPEVMNGFPEMHLGITSAPIIYKNLVFTGGHNPDLPGSKGPAGDVRAWDLRNGKLVWTFHTVPRPGETGNETWLNNSWKNVTGVNVWSFFTLDEQRGILYMPLGCAQSDFYGIDRPGDNLFSDSIVAVDAMTGKLKWHFQAVHHDIWDYDMPIPPILFDVVKDGKKIPAVGFMTKNPLLFIFDRVTGKPIYGVEERPVPKGDIPGEWYAPTQPFPVKPPPLGRISFNYPDDLAKVTPEHEAGCRAFLDTYEGGRNKGPYTPPSEKGALVVPNQLGGAEMMGGTFDPALGYYIINIANTGRISTLQKMDEYLATATPEQKSRLIIKTELPSIYMHVGPMVGINGWPCWPPPWSSLVAVNVNTGDIAWSVPFGTAEGAPAGMNTGAPNSQRGGPTTTAGGVLFIGAASDRYFRAYETKTGKELWSVKTEELIQGNPITYMGKDGKQYVSVAAGTTLLTFKLP